MRQQETPKKRAARRIFVTSGLLVEPWRFKPRVCIQLELAYSESGRIVNVVRGVTSHSGVGLLDSNS